jgi:hypothetical protein
MENPPYYSADLFRTDDIIFTHFRYQSGKRVLTKLIGQYDLNEYWKFYDSVDIFLESNIVV